MNYSVIIPIYNSSTTLHGCLESLAEQSKGRAEVLLIDDGSSDDSRDICLNFQLHYPHFKYFYQKNEGVSAARNYGLSLAQGDYILFVDSDDYVSSDYFSTLDLVLHDEQIDLLLFGYQNFGQYNSSWNLGEYTVNDPLEIAKKVSIGMREYLFSSLWSKAFKRSIIMNNRLQFCTDLYIGEDQAFIFDYSLHVSCIKSIKEILYHVNTDGASSLSRRRRDYLLDHMLIMNQLMGDYLSKSDLPSKVSLTYEKALVWIYYRSAYSCLKELYKYPYSKEGRKIKIKQICNAYDGKNQKVGDYKTFLISLPIRLKMVRIIEFVLNKKFLKR